MSQTKAILGPRTNFALKKTAIALLGVAASVPAWALSDFNDSSTGVSCRYWDEAAKVAWKNQGGDWVDASGTAQGTNAFRTVYISDTNTVKPVSMDVTTLVKNWGNSSVYRGIVLKNVGGVNTVDFKSREGGGTPTLVVRYADGTTSTLAAKADSQLQCPWYYSIGGYTYMKLDKVQNIVLRFDAPRRTDVVGATLTLTTTAQYGNVSMGAFQMVPPGSVTTGTTTPTTGTTTPTTGTTTPTTGTTTPTTGTTTPTTGTTTPTTGTTTPTTGTTTPSTSLSTEPPAWYRLYDGSTGVTCTAWNSAAKLNWRNKGGDWLDANGSAQGTSAFSKVAVSGAGRAFDFDVTRLVQGWAAPSRYRGIMLRSETGSGFANFSSREASASPVLTIKYNDGTSVSVKPDGDSHLDCSTVYGSGKGTWMQVSSSRKTALSFNVPRRGDVQSATLRMTTTSDSGSTTVGTYQLNQPETGVNVPFEPGLAASYPGDVGIENDPNVVFVERFENPKFYQSTKWGYTTLPAEWQAEVVSSDTNGYQSISGNSYRVRVPAGKNFGTAIALYTQKALGYRPTELYMRYNLRFGSNFRDTADGGKMPGFAMDISTNGNAGRAVDGTDSWSLRGSFFNSTDPSNPIYPRVLLGTYAYHADMPSNYGDHWPWQKNGLGMVEQNRWYSVEQYVKLNTPGQRNGILKVWIDGKLAYEKTDLNLRTIDGLPIHMAWIDHWYGGTGTPTHDLAFYMDNMVLSKKYIGPMKK